MTHALVDQTVAAWRRHDEILRFLLDAVPRGELKLRQFGRDAVRWMSYLVSHESRHRGRMMLALKQSGFRLPEKAAVGGLWGKWIMGK